MATTTKRFYSTDKTGLLEELNTPVKTSFVAAINNLKSIVDDASLLDATSVAGVYSSSSSYKYYFGDYCLYNSRLYICTANTTGGSWDSSKWQLASVCGALRDRAALNVANVFNASTLYKKGDYVVFAGRLYRSLVDFTSTMISSDHDPTSAPSYWTIAYFANDYEDNLKSYLAQPFSTLSRYDAGTYVTYNNTLHRCIKDVTTAGAWTGSTNWESVRIGLELMNHLWYMVPPFLKTLTYVVGDFVSYNGAIYRCTSDVTTAGAWDSNNWTRTSVSWMVDTKFASIIAPNFSTSSTYSAGDYVIRGSELYRCVVDITNAGAWDYSKWTPTSITSDMLLILKSLAPDYVEQTYKAGDLCVKNGRLYHCRTGIETPEAWTASHWDPWYVSYTLQDIYNKIALPYNSSWTYTKGSYVIYEGYLYKATQNINTAESWTGNHWALVVSLGDELTSVFNNPICDPESIASEYDSSQAYMVNDYCMYDGKLYRAIYATTGSWDPTKWIRADVVSDMLTITDAITEIAAKSYSNIKTYNPGEYITRYRTLYRRDDVTPSSGAWRITDWTEVTVGDEILNILNALAPRYSSASTYSVGDVVVYDSTFYECTTAITTAESWTAAHWTQASLASFKIIRNLAPNYDSTATYGFGDYVIHDDKLYRHTTDIDYAEAWNSSHWTLVNVGGALENGFANTAPQFDIQASYDVGDYVMYNEKLYKCITAIDQTPTDPGTIDDDDDDLGLFSSSPSDIPTPDNTDYWTQTTISEHLLKPGFSMSLDSSGDILTITEVR